MPGDYVIQLTVTDSHTQSASDTVAVSFGNVRPVASAGKSLAVKVGDTVTLAGDGTDANGDAFSYRWILSSRSGESRSEVADSLARVTTFVPDRAGAYVAHLIVSDGELDSGVRPLYYVNRLSCNRKSKSVNFLPKLVPSFSRVRQRAQTQYNCSATLFPFHPSAAQPLFHDNFTCCFGYS